MEDDKERSLSVIFHSLLEIILILFLLTALFEDRFLQRGLAAYGGTAWILALR